MKKRRMIALILAGALLAGQTVYAQEMTPASESVDAESEEISDDVKNPQEISADQEEVQIEESVHSEQNVMAGSNDENQSKISGVSEETYPGCILKLLLLYGTDMAVQALKKLPYMIQAEKRLVKIMERR